MSETADEYADGRKVCRVRRPIFLLPIATAFQNPCGSRPSGGAPIRIPPKNAVRCGSADESWDWCQWQLPKDKKDRGVESRDTACPGFLLINRARHLHRRHLLKPLRFGHLRALP